MAETTEKPRITVSAEAVASPVETVPLGSSKKKPRTPRGWSGFSYTTRLTLAFAFVAAMTALVAIGVMSFVWDMYFKTYTSDNMKSVASTTADRIAEVYKETGSLWNASTIRPAESVLVVTPGVGVKVLDAAGGVPFDSSTLRSDSDSGKREGLVLGSSDLRSVEPKDTSQVAMANIVVDDVVVGSVHIWVYGSDTLMRQVDLQFRDASYQAMLVAAILAIVLAACIGFLFARNLVAPIKRMTKTASAIKEGNLAARTGLTGDDEIARLGITFDEMAESVEKDRELERRLTTDVAHELRTPLMAIQSTVEAMVDGVFEADEERLETVNSEVQRLSRLVDALLKLSRLENRTTPLKEEVLDVGELIEGIISTHDAFVSDSGLSLTYESEPGVKVKGDPDMIRQATANLISNAVRYTPEGGSIHVKVSKGDIMANIAVRDTGIGLTPEEAKMVFSRFWRADAGRTRASGGLGIGLAVVKEIVDRHGGWVQVEGKKDEGACFTIHIPLYAPQQPQNRGLSAPWSGSRNNRNAAGKSGGKQGGSSRSTGVLGLRK